MSKLKPFNGKKIYEDILTENIKNLIIDFGKENFKTYTDGYDREYLAYQLKSGGFVKITNEKYWKNQFIFDYHPEQAPLVSMSPVGEPDFNKIFTYNAKSIKKYLDFYEFKDNLTKEVDAKFILEQERIQNELIKEGYTLIMDYSSSVAQKVFFKASDARIYKARIVGNLLNTPGYALNIYAEKDYRTNDAFKSEMVVDLIEKGILPTYTNLFEHIDKMLTERGDRFPLTNSLYYSVVLSVSELLPNTHKAKFKMSCGIVEVDGYNFKIKGKGVSRVDLRKHLTNSELLELRNHIIEEIKRINKKVVL